MPDASPDTPEARRARRLLWALPAGLAAMLGLARLGLDAGVTSRWLASQVAGALAAQARASVQLSGVRFDWALAPCFEDFVLYRYHGPARVRLAAPRACVREWAAAVGSGLHAVRVELEAPSIEVRAGDPRPRAERAAPPASSATSGSELLREVVLAFDDLRLEWGDLPLPGRWASGSFGPIDGRFTLQARGAAVAAVVELEEPRTGTELSGRLAPSAGGWDLAAGVEGDLVAVFGELLSSDAVRLRRMPTRGRVGARWSPREERLELDVDLEQHDVDFESALVARSRLVGFSARERGRLTLDLGARTLDVRGGRLEVNGIPVEVDVRVGEGTGDLRFGLGARLRPAPFREILASIPGAAAPELVERIDPGVTLAAELELGGAPRRPATWSARLDYRVEGLDEGPSGLEPYLAPFPYRPLTETGRRPEPLTVGPGTPRWRSYDQLPYVLRRAIIVSEDATFPFHRGIELEEIKHALEDAFEGDDRPRGGSTITQQLVKNLFLTPDRTALRKAREAALTLLLEAALEKRQIFELYVNLIEWGPDVYGIHHAAEHYFGTLPERLTPRQMAYLATLIPGPRLYHRHHEAGRVPYRHRKRVDALLDRLHRLGQLEDAAWARAKKARLRFAPEPAP